MKKKVLRGLVGGCLLMSFAAERSLLAMDPPVSLAGSSRDAEPKAEVEPGVGLMQIFARGTASRPHILAKESHFAKGGGSRPAGPDLPASVRGIRRVLRDEFYQSLRGGVAILDRTLAEWGASTGKELHLGVHDQIALAAQVDEAVRPLLSRYHSGERHRRHTNDPLDHAATLVEAREQVYQQMFAYLSDRAVTPQVREFLQEHFQPRSQSGVFEPRPEVRSQFLALWTKHFEQQLASGSFFPPLPSPSWHGLLTSYYEQLWRSSELLGDTAPLETKQGIETFLRLIVGWAPLEQGVDPQDRVALQKMAVLPFQAAGAHQRFVQELIAVVRSVVPDQFEEPRDGYYIQRSMQGTLQALARLRATEDTLGGTRVAENGRNAAGEAEANRRARSFQQIFEPGTPVAQLREQMRTKNFRGLLGVRTLQRLEHSTAVLEGTMASLGIQIPEPLYAATRDRLTAILCEGYHQYPIVGTTEEKIVQHVRLIEGAYWKEMAQAYPEATLQGKLGAGFLPTAEASGDFIREFSKQAREKAVPELSLAETQRLQTMLPRLRTKEAVMEVVLLLFAHGVGYQAAQLPALEHVRQQMQECELHPSWVNRRSWAVSHVIRELAVLYRAYPKAPQLQQVKRLLQPLLDVGFGLPDPPAGGTAQEPRRDSVLEREALPRQEGIGPSPQEGEQGREFVQGQVPEARPPSFEGRG